MPKLDQLYREHKNQGFLVYGLSEEDPATQRKGLAKIPVTYPLLTYDGQIRSLYRYIAMYPTTFVIDRRGILQPAISGDQALEKLDNTIVTLRNGQPRGVPAVSKGWHKRPPRTGCAVWFCIGVCRVAPR